MVTIKCEVCGGAFEVKPYRKVTGSLLLPFVQGQMDGDATGVEQGQASAVGRGQ